MNSPGIFMLNRECVICLYLQICWWLRNLCFKLRLFITFVNILTTSTEDVTVLFQVKVKLVEVQIFSNNQQLC